MDNDALQYVVAHAGSPLNPVLSNLLIYVDESGQHRAQAQNGRYTVDVPTDLPPMLVNAERIAAVWAACDGTPRASAGDSWCTVTAGRLRARIALADPAQYPRTTPTEKTAHSAAWLAGALRLLLPFVATDASRPWATSICITGTHAYATNNVILARAQVDTGLEVPANLPGSSVEAILKCGAIEYVGADELSMTFYLEGGIWVRCQLVSGSWPTDTVDGMLAGLGSEWVTVHPELVPMLNVAAKLSDDRHPAVVFQEDGCSLALSDDSLLAGDLAPLPTAGKINAKMGSLVFGVAKEVQWHTPRKDTHAFRCDGGLVGLLGGMR